MFLIALTTMQEINEPNEYHLEELERNYKPRKEAGDKSNGRHVTSVGPGGLVPGNTDTLAHYMGSSKAKRGPSDGAVHKIPLFASHNLCN